MAIGIASAIGGTALRLAPRLATPAARRLSLALLKRKGLEYGTKAAIKGKPLLTKGQTLATKASKTKLGRKTLNILSKTDKNLRSSQLQRMLGKADPSLIDKGLSARGLPRVSPTIQINRLLKNPKSIVGVGGKLGKGLILWDAYNKTKEVFNPKDNIVHSIRNLGLAIKGDKTTLRHGQSRIAQLQNKKIKAAQEQAAQAEGLLKTLSKKERLEVEQELESQQKEQAVKGKEPVVTVNNVVDAVDNKVEQSVTPIEDDGGRQEWLDKTANSPAANAGFSEDERWALQEQHRKWKKNRGKKKRKPYGAMGRGQRQ